VNAVVRTLVCLVLAAGIAHAQPAADPLDARLRRLETELRCLVCQNQTLADSDAPLAVDLRNEIRAMAVKGRSDDDIRAFLLERYGDFVLYKPRFTPITWLLWLGPFALLIVGGLIGWAVVRGRARAAAAAAPSPAAEQAARDLLS
jgi:cytochrome c-type biogenesis protein CcmH